MTSYQLSVPVPVSVSVPLCLSASGHNILTNCLKINEQQQSAAAQRSSQTKQNAKCENARMRKMRKMRVNTCKTERWRGEERRACVKGKTPAKQRAKNALLCRKRVITNNGYKNKTNTRLQHKNKRKRKKGEEEKEKEKCDNNKLRYM